MKILNVAPVVQQANRRKRYSFMGIGFFAFTMLSMLFLPLVITPLLIKLIPSLAGHYILGMPLTYFYLYVICLPLLLLFLKKIPDQPASVLEKKINFKTILFYYFIVVFMMTGINMGALSLDALLGITTTASMDSLTQMEIPQWLMFVIGVVVAPVMEEVLFRGLPYKKLSAFGEKNYVIWTSIVFGLFHMNFGQSLYTAVAGIFLGILTYRTGTIKYSIILHMLMNFFGGIGIGSIIMGTGNQMALIIYSSFNLLCALLGLIFFIVFMVRYRKSFWLKKDSFGFSTLLNPGTILYAIFPLVTIVSYFLR